MSRRFNYNPQVNSILLTPKNTTLVKNINQAPSSVPKYIFNRVKIVSSRVPLKTAYSYDSFVSRNLDALVRIFNSLPSFSNPIYLNLCWSSINYYRQQVAIVKHLYIQQLHQISSYTKTHQIHQCKIHKIYSQYLTEKYRTIKLVKISEQGIENTFTEKYFIGVSTLKSERIGINLMFGIPKTPLRVTRTKGFSARKLYNTYWKMKKVLRVRKRKIRICKKL